MKSKFTIAFIAGARPNFMKIAPILRALKKYHRFRPYLIHTGQHYDKAMSKEIFSDLGLPKPNVNLGVGSGTHAEQTGQVMARLEKIALKRKLDLILVVGDVNSTMAATLVGSKLHIPIAHVEAGLRSGDWSMPEEINRIVTDSISDMLFTHCKEADENLLSEGISKNKIFFVGNVMIDTLYKMLPEAKILSPPSSSPYGLITIHRPSNVDHPARLRKIMRALYRVAEETLLIFPVHPRTSQQLRKLNLSKKPRNLRLIAPISYLPFLSAMASARFVLTDSGGIQEETTALSVPCLTFRENSERMVTVHKGTNRIIGNDPQKIVPEIHRLLKRRVKRIGRPPLWDGKAGERIVKVLAKSFL